VKRRNQAGEKTESVLSSTTALPTFWSLSSKLWSPPQSDKKGPRIDAGGSSSSLGRDEYLPLALGAWDAWRFRHRTFGFPGLSIFKHLWKIEDLRFTAQECCSAGLLLCC